MNVTAEDAEDAEDAEEVQENNRREHSASMVNFPPKLLLTPACSPSFLVFLCVQKGYSTLREGIRVLCGGS